MNETIDSVVTFWFGSAKDPAEIARQQKTIWWGKDEAVDREMKQRFSDIVEAVVAGELNHWQSSAKGLLACILCTDQFPRNIFRGRAQSYAYDEFALSLARKTVAAGKDQELEPIQRVFVYMPFEHSEDSAMQDEAVRLTSALEQEAVGNDREIFANYRVFAERHREIIRQFGRFPHRNRILGRTSTAEEEVFLQSPGSSF